MSFQAYIDNIKAKTGKSPEDFKKLAEKKGLLRPDVKAGEIVAWLKKDFELGHGHAMAIYTVFKGLKEKTANKVEAIDSHFQNTKSKWRPVFENLMKKVSSFGDDIIVEPAISYLSILRGKSKIAIVQVMNERMDIGIKRKGTPATDRFENAGTWNVMMTHRVRINGPKEVDKELVSWLHEAYKLQGKK
ncbi:MAG TPA: DUF4287 domain-containing protein [Chitinophagaceae bacterium]